MKVCNNTRLPSDAKIAASFTKENFLPSAMHPLRLNRHVLPHLKNDEHVLWIRLALDQLCVTVGLVCVVRLRPLWADSLMLANFTVLVDLLMPTKRFVIVRLLIARALASMR
jgi:hypothetical protein